MPTDWIGIALSLIIILGIIFIVIAKIQGDRVIDVLQQFMEVLRGK